MRTADDIAKDNDLFRNTLLLSLRHKVVLTESVTALKESQPTAFVELITQVRNFKNFNEDNDPWGEHDFGRVEIDGAAYFWKLDYYADDWNSGADPKIGKTNLLMTIMRADEY